MIKSFKTKKIKGSPSGYFLKKEDFNSKKLKGFKNIGNTKEVSKNDQSWFTPLLRVFPFKPSECQDIKVVDLDSHRNPLIVFQPDWLSQQMCPRQGEKGSYGNSQPTGADRTNLF